MKEKANSRDQESSGKLKVASQKTLKNENDKIHS